MNLRKRYSDYSDEKLVAIVEGNGFTKPAKLIAEKMLTERRILPETLKSYSKAFFKDYFKDQFNGTVLTQMAEPEFPDSKYLSTTEIKEIIQEIYAEIRANRNDFYSNLPYI